MTANQYPILRYLRPGQFPGICFEAGDGKEGNDGKKEAEAFSEAQQEKVQALIDSAVGRANKAAEKRQADADAKWEARVKALEESKPPAPKDDKEKSIPLAELAKLKAEWEADFTKNHVTPKEAQIKSLLDAKRNAEVINAAAKLNCVDPAMVAKLTNDAISFDEEGSIVIRDANGKDRYGKEGPMTVTEMLGEFLKDKPFLVKAQSQPGGGSGAPKNGQKPNGMANLSPTEKIQAGLNAQESGSRDEFAN